MTTPTIKGEMRDKIIEIKKLLVSKADKADMLDGYEGETRAFIGGNIEGRNRAIVEVLEILEAKE